MIHIWETIAQQIREYMTQLHQACAAVDFSHCEEMADGSFFGFFVARTDNLGLCGMGET